MPESLVGLFGVFVPFANAPSLYLPIDEVRVSAGFPSPAADYEDKRLDINEYLVRNSRRCTLGRRQKWPQDGFRYAT